MGSPQLVPALGQIRCGFKQPKNNSCLYLRKDCDIVAYMYNCLVLAPKKEMINNLMVDLAVSFKLQDGDVSSFLGIHKHKGMKTKTIHIT